LIAFKANADGEIELDDVVAVDTTVNAVTANDIGNYDTIYLGTANKVANFDSKRFEIEVAGTDKRFKVTSDTTLLNMADKEVIKWKELVDEDDEFVDDFDSDDEFD